MACESIRLVDVSFAFDGAPYPLFDHLTLSFERGWTGIIGANGVGKTTLLDLASGRLVPCGGRVTGPPEVGRCEQQTDVAPPGLSSLLNVVDSERGRLRGRLGLKRDWCRRWSSLSHGERKRAQLAVALGCSPPALVVDEPSNHLDPAARRMVREVLRRYRGIGLIVSHDRDLLDALCDRCLFIDRPLLRMFPGTYSEAREQLDREKREARQGHRRARDTLQRIQGEAHVRRQQEKKAARKRSRRHISRGDHDAREKANRARLTDGKSGRRLRQLDGQLRRARERVQSFVLVPRRKIGISVRGQRSQLDLLVHLEAGMLSPGPSCILDLPELYLQPHERVALVGPNGCGKSSLLRLLLERVKLPQEHIAYLPQELDAGQTGDLIEQARALSPARLSQALGLVSRLGSQAEPLLDGVAPSPGEARKLMMAVRLTAEPRLIVLDEPTNHLDLLAVECLERALEDCEAALLLVSHDERFLSALTQRRWSIRRQEDDDRRFVLVDEGQASVDLERGARSGASR